MLGYKLLRVLSSSSNQGGFSQCLSALDWTGMSYDQIFQALKDSLLLYPNGFKKEMTQLGWEVMEVVPNCFPLQKHWANTHGHDVDPSDAQWKEKLFIQQVQYFKPHVLYFERGCGWSLFSDSFRRTLKRQCPSIKLVVGFLGNTGTDYHRFRDVDWMFVMDEVFHRAFQRAKIPSQVCHHSFEPQILDCIPRENQKKEDFIFSGVSGFGLPDHRQRYLDLLELMKSSPLQAWCLEYSTIPLRQKIRSKLVRGLGHLPRPGLTLFHQLLDRFFPYSSTSMRIVKDAIRCKGGEYFNDWYFGYQPLASYYPTRVHKPVFGLKYFQLIHEAKIVLNRHADAPGHYANMRTFEVCGMGSCLLTDRGQEMKHLFALDEEICSFDTVEECREKAEYLLRRPNVWEEMGRKAKKRVFAQHLFSHRAQEIHERLEKLLLSKLR